MAIFSINKRVYKKWSYELWRKTQKKCKTLNFNKKKYSKYKITDGENAMTIKYKIKFLDIMRFMKSLHHTLLIILLNDFKKVEDSKSYLKFLSFDKMLLFNC